MVTFTPLLVKLDDLVDDLGVFPPPLARLSEDIRVPSLLYSEEVDV